MLVTIQTTMGQVILDFQSIQLALDTGQDTDYKAIERVCDEYWAEWKAKRKSSTSA
ncbi:MAG TPA: hypothetical protein VLA67_01435 [Nitrospiraceae bacterium]|nr:hypothetical protein [Nitrospiraceae bacterium]